MRKLSFYKKKVKTLVFSKWGGVTLNTNFVVFSIPMKRCNNCGWYNLDSAASCEKCEEDSFEPVIEVSPESEVEPEVEQVPEIITVPEEKHEESPKRNPMMETVAFSAEHIVSQMPSDKRKFAATVLDTTTVLKAENDSYCPKCRYPIIGYVAYCPNCGATVKNNPEPGVSPVSKVTKIESSEEVTKPVDLKVTVRDIPEELIKEDPDIFRIVPLDKLGETPYEIHIGDVIVIGGCRYRLEK